MTQPPDGYPSSEPGSHQPPPADPFLSPPNWNPHDQPTERPPWSASQGPPEQPPGHPGQPPESAGPQYGPPGQPGPPGPPQYGPPQYGSPQYGPPGPPEPQYGPPPGPQYGPPPGSPGPQYGAPGQPYGPPDPQYGPPDPQYGPPGPPYGPPGGPPPGGPAPRRRRGLLILAAGLAGVLVLCAGGGVGAWLLTRDTDEDGAVSPVAAVQSFMQAVYRDRSPAAAAELVCSEARDEDSLTEKVDEINSYEETQAEPSFQWTEPEIVEETEQLAVVAVTVTVTTADEQVADQTLHVSVLDKDDAGWWVCDLETVDPDATPDEESPAPDQESPAPDQDGGDGEADENADDE